MDEKYGFDEFLTHGIPDDFDSDSDDNNIQDHANTDNIYVPTTDAGDHAFEIVNDDDLKQTRGVNIFGRVILNFVGTLLTRQRHQLKSSSIHKYFLQRIVTTSIGESVSLLFPEGILFPTIFWLMREGFLVGAISATLLNENSKKYGFATIPQHVR